MHALQPHDGKVKMEATPTRPTVRYGKTRKTFKTGEKRKYGRARAFFLVLFMGTILATYALFARQYLPDNTGQATSPNLQRRDLQPSTDSDEECRLVHRAKDQCAFIKSRCPTDEAGFAAYLDLYYCRLAHAKPVAFIVLISWLGVLFSTIGIAASDFFCIDLSTIASILGMGESMAGVTLLAFGNGSPDVFSTFAAMNTNSGSLALGELMGAAGFITAVVAGSMALIRPFHVARKSFIRDVGFFAVAAAFSMSFLWDGKLQLWECLAMVVYYVFYVAFVVAWHWWLGRRRKRRERDAAARGHFLPAGEELEIEQEPYHDEPEEDGEQPTISRNASFRSDFAALENGNVMPFPDFVNEEEEEEARDRWMSELNSNMRLSRPAARSRRNTLMPVRPSLVGALEFQAVLNSLQKSRNIQTIPLSSRRYSDDPSFTTAQQQDIMSTTSDPAARPPFQLRVDTATAEPVMKRGGALQVPKSAPVRGRAVSANDASTLRLDTDLKWPGQGGNSAISGDATQGQTPHQLLDLPNQDQSAPQTPILQISAPAPSSERSTQQQVLARRSPDHLAAPGEENSFFRTGDHFAPRSPWLEAETPHDSPRTVPSARTLPRIEIARERRSRRSSTANSSPFPPYRDETSPLISRPPSLNLPPSIASPESLPVSQYVGEETSPRPLRWWPYRFLPPPGVLISTLFPTIYHWHEKSIWEKMLGVVAAPSVFLLTITLPVVESEKDVEESDAPAQKPSFDSTRARNSNGNPWEGASSKDGHNINGGSEVAPGSHHHSSMSGAGTAIAGLAAHTEEDQRHNAGTRDVQNIPSIALEQPGFVSSPGAMPADLDQQPSQSAQPELWNRWLTIVQLFIAPIFTLLAIYSQASDDLTPRWLLKPSLICLGVCICLLVPFLLTTTPTHRPSYYRIILSLAGFLVSIAWISTIAAQVVGALKALAVILNMSHAIMGLTIFAVGNSLGDLVADITVARLGYPVMALAACFGGPMLNILLGIGLSGSYILINGAEKRAHKHPDKGLRFKSYHIDVGQTLIVSGATLLITLVGLLIAVPLNNWVMSRRIGWCLIAVWVISTVGNVVLEVTGWGGFSSEG